MIVVIFALKKSCVFLLKSPMWLVKSPRCTKNHNFLCFSELSARKRCRIVPWFAGLPLLVFSKLSWQPTQKNIWGTPNFNGLKPGRWSGTMEFFGHPLGLKKRISRRSSQRYAAVRALRAPRNSSRSRLVFLCQLSLLSQFWDTQWFPTDEVYDFPEG